MKHTNKTRTLALLLLAALTLGAVLSSCASPFGGVGKDDLSSWIHDAADSYLQGRDTATAATTTAPVSAPVTVPTTATTTAPPTTADSWLHDAADSYGAGAGGDGHAVTAAELHAFLDLVNYNKVLAVQYSFREYYVGEFRTLYTVAYESHEFFEHLVGNYLIEDITETEDATGVFINSYIDVLGDKYGYYYDPESYDSYEQDITGEYSGIGVSVTLTESNYLEVLAVFPSSPAETVGMLPGDLVVAVEGNDVAQIGYQQTVNRIQGEVGTQVTITILREGERFDLTITRAKVTEYTVDSKMLDGNVGYIRITSFDDRTYEQFVSAYTALEGEGATSLIFDVRYNPGGTLTSVVAILEYILPDGNIVHMKYKNPIRNQDITSINDVDSSYMNSRTYYPNHEITLPMVVLANDGTASAGELFTSSLQDYGVATVLGVTTYGKGVGQSGFYVTNDGSVVIITIFFYDPPLSQNYNEKGIEPDIVSELTGDAAKKNIYKLTWEEDTQLRAAYALLTQE